MKLKLTLLWISILLLASHEAMASAGKAADEKLKIQGRLQARYSYETEGAFGGDDDESAFSIPRARLKLSGQTLKGDLTWVFQVDFGKGDTTLKDLVVNYRILPWLHLRAGQWKRPFSREHLTSSGKLALVDRARTDKAFFCDRDIGIAVQNDFMKSPVFEYSFGLFNGSGVKSFVVDDKRTNIPDFFDPALVGRIGYNYGGIKGYSQADLEGGGLRASLAASSIYRLSDDDGEQTSKTLVEIDSMIKYRGFSMLAAVFKNFSDNADTKNGLTAQAGFVVANRYQPVVRYSLLDGIKDDGESSTTQIVSTGLSVYLMGHKLKLQTDAGVEIQSGSSNQDYLIRTQLQFVF